MYQSDSLKQSGYKKCFSFSVVEGRKVTCIHEGRVSFGLYTNEYLI